MTQETLADIAAASDAYVISIGLRRAVARRSFALAQLSAAASLAVLARIEGRETTWLDAEYDASTAATLAALLVEQAYSSA